MTKTNALVKVSDADRREFDRMCEEIYKVTHEKFYKAALTQLVAYKVYLGRAITTSSIYGAYGENMIEDISRETSISRTVLYDAIKMYEKERLTPKKEKEFIKSFPGKYDSWNDFKTKRLSTGGKSTPEKKVECKHCPLHCNG